MTATITRNAEAVPRIEFTEAEMNAIDRAAVKVYTQSRAVLPPHLLAAGSCDPAGALRSVAYDYACGHPSDIRSRTPGQVFHHVRTRLQQHVTRELSKRLEQPYGSAEDVREYVTQPSPRTASPTNHHCIDLYGRILPPDQIPFMVKGWRAGRPVWEDPEVIAKLHTRLPSRAEFWEQVCSEWDRKEFRRNIGETFNAGICYCDSCTTALSSALR